MNRLDELIEELCPHGVDFKPLEKCCTVLDNKRKPVTKASRQEGEYPYYGANGIQDYVAEYIFDGTFILVGEDGSVITPNGTPVVNWAEGKIWVNNHAHIIEEKSGVLLRYLYHYLQIVNVKPFIHGNIPKLTGGDFRALQIPVPPLPVQHEIVRILDSFTELTAELTAELAARKKQYEYYLNTVLTRESVVEWKQIEECTEKTQNIKWKDTNEEYQYIDLSSVDRMTSKITGTTTIDKKTAPSRAQQIVHTNDILFGTTRPLLRRYCLIPSDYNNQIASTGFCVLRANESIVLPQYLYFVIQTDAFYKYIEPLQVQGSYPSVTNNNVKGYTIPIPDLKVQREIVRLLSNFEQLCNDISTGLPAEIAARQKQYEYYRDKLLTFKPLV